jgi:type VI protein secretion system component Hcp
MAAYLWIDGLPGESRKLGHRGQIEIAGVRFGGERGVNASRASAGGPTTYDARSITDITVIKQVDRISVELQAAYVSGKLFPAAALTITFGSTKGGPLGLSRFEMKNVVISFIRPAANAAGIAHEEIGLNFTQLIKTS